MFLTLLHGFFIVVLGLLQGGSESVHDAFQVCFSEFLECVSEGVSWIPQDFLRIISGLFQGGSRIFQVCLMFLTKHAHCNLLSMA